MKVIVNACYGLFELKESVAETYGLSVYDHGFDVRMNPELIARIENGEDIGSIFSKLEVVTIPDDITDVVVEDEDGMENLIYVRNGRIFFA